MNENELKARLQHDAELFSKVFDEELCKRIKKEVSAQVAPMQARSPHHFMLLYAVLICSSIFMGIGIWSLMRSHSPTDPNSMTQTGANVHHSDSRMNIMPSQVGLSQESVTAQSSPLRPQPSVFDVPNGTLFDLSVSKDQPLEMYIQVLIPGRDLVRLSRHMDLQPEDGDVPDKESASSFFDDAAEVVRVPVGWILEEE